MEKINLMLNGKSHDMGIYAKAQKAMNDLAAKVVVLMRKHAGNKYRYEVRETETRHQDTAPFFSITFIVEQFQEKELVSTYRVTLHDDQVYIRTQR